MINKFMEYLKQNKLFFLLLLIIVIIFCYLYIFPKLFSFFEGMEQVKFIQEPQAAILNVNDVVGKYVHLEYKRPSKDNLTIKTPYYLALMKKIDCINAFKGFGNDCNNNIAIIQQIKNNFSTFYLEKELNSNPPRYSLRSILDIINPPRLPLSQNLNYLNSTAFACFDGGVPDAVYFELETTNRGYLLKFKITVEKRTQYFYLSECSNNIVNKCESGNNNDFPRLCIYPDRNAAIAFTFELSDFQPIVVQPEQPIKNIINKNSQENIESELDSLKTLNSESIETLMSLPGADDVSFHLETFGYI